MEQNHINAAQVLETFEYDGINGLLVWKAGGQFPRMAGRKAGKRDKYGYVYVQWNHASYAAHRLIWTVVHGSAPKGFIDHINGVRSDNRIQNLREATHQINNQNRRVPSRNSTTGYLGVTRVKTRTDKPFSAHIKLNKKKIHIGQFRTPEQAHEAYIKAKRELHAGCTI